MKQLQKSDLKEGEIYWFIGSTIKFLNKISTTNINRYSNYLYNNTYCNMEGTNLQNAVSILETTPEEKHWLETCIIANEFISYEEAMKTFVTEYYEYIDDTNLYNTEFIKGKTYKIVNKNDLEDSFNFINEKGEPNGWSGNNWKYFKPSTKEAYDAQFVVKEPEFVLPEKWAIIITNENKDIVNEYRKSIFNNSNISCNLNVDNVHLSDRYDGTYYHYNKYHFKEHTNCEEITFDQFKQYVLKENTTVTGEPKVVLEEPKDKVLTLSSNYGKESIVKVECSEGGVYRIGDKITVFDKYSPNKGKPFIIKSFRWSNDKSKICAVTELHTPNGISLDKIELYIKPKVKIVDDFVLPENWYVKVTDDDKEVLQQYNCNIYNLTMITLSNINHVAYSKWLNGVNKTENKLGYSLISNLNLNPLPNVYRTVTCYNGVEITFEQFKKYVLKDE